MSSSRDRQPDDFARVVVPRLANARLITGDTIRVDGGSKL